MNTTEHDELAGRIEGLAQALLRLSAMLETRGLIDGPRLSRCWRQAVCSQSPRRAALRTLQQLAGALDESRAVRTASARPPGVAGSWASPT